MGGDFKFEANSTHSIFMVDPKVSPDEVGLYVLTTKVCLQNYPSICKNLDLNFEITPCEVTLVSNFMQTVDMSYTLGEAPLEWSLVTAGMVTQIPSCGYEVNYNVCITPAF